MERISSNTTSPRLIIDNFWNYSTVLGLGIAHLPEGNVKFNSDAESWHNTVDQAQKRSPEILKGIHFDRRPGIFPYSDEVAQFLFQMQISDKFVLSPDAKSFVISEATKQRIVTRTPQPLTARLSEILEVSHALSPLVILK